MISDVHRRLRAATQGDHQRLDGRMDILARIATPAGRRTLVERFHEFHAEAEGALTPWLAGHPALEFDARRRSAILACDLTALGVTPAPASREVTSVGGVSEALGWMYVLEGSTLGGRVIRRSVEAQGGDMAGLSFLEPYGNAVGERWRAFLAVLDAETRTPADVEATVAGAACGFRHAERRLCDALADV